jgi:hypothetical protein
MAAARAICAEFLPRAVLLARAAANRYRPLIVFTISGWALWHP